MNDQNNNSDQFSDEGILAQLQQAQIDLTEYHIERADRFAGADQLFVEVQDRVTKELGTKFKLNKDLAEFNYYTFAHVASRERVGFLVIYNTWAFALDDMLDQNPKEYKNWMEFLKNQSFSGNDPLSKWSQLMVKVGNEVLGKDGMIKLMEIFAWTISHIPDTERVWSGQTQPTDQEYRDLRAIDCGAYHELHIVMVDAEVDLTEELKNDRDWKGLIEYTNHHFGCLNDVYSFEKEVKDGVGRFNYVFVKMRNHQLSPQQAVNVISKELKDWERMAHLFGDNLKKFNNEKINRFVDGCYTAMTGHHYWSTICERYK